MSDDNLKPDKETAMPFLAILDEMGYYFLVNDKLRARLRAHPDVPNATYLVRERKVFVFDKLVDLVSVAGLGSDGEPDADLVAKLLPQAWLEPEVAIAAHGIVPRPYSLVEVDGTTAILHEPFDAVLPGIYATKADAYKALGTLLVGGVISGTGQFEFHGQAMTPRFAFDLEALPPQPAIDVAFDGDVPYFHRLSRSSHIAGWAALPQDIFGRLVDVHDSWAEAAARAHLAARAGAAGVWHVVADLAVLSDTGAVVPEYDIVEGKELERIYPELALLGAGRLYELYDEFQRGVWFARSWIPSRDDDFLFFLIGRIVLGGDADADSAKQAGLFAGFAILRGAVFADGVRFGADCAKYQDALSLMAVRARSIIRFLTHEVEHPMSCGSAVLTSQETLMGMAKIGRKYKSVPMQATQSLADFVDKSLGLRGK